VSPLSAARRATFLGAPKLNGLDFGRKSAYEDIGTNLHGIAQPAPYHGLPSMPMEVHQAVFVGNAAAEAKSLQDRASQDSTMKVRGKK